MARKIFRDDEVIDVECKEVKQGDSLFVRICVLVLFCWLFQTFFRG